jgi:hypothetical protein
MIINPTMYRVIPLDRIVPSRVIHRVIHRLR